MRNVIIFIFYIFLYIEALGQSNVLQIFDGKSYTPLPWSEIESISFDEESKTLIIGGSDKDISISVTESVGIPSGSSLSLINITTDEYLEEIPNKEEYKSANLDLMCYGEYEDVSGRVNIRGRGNSSWTFEKKPYRLKFDKKVSLCGLPRSKSYVLLANYTDCSLIQNALAFKIGELLELPYTHRCVPVDVVLNGIYKGSYLLTNKPGINAGSVDIDESASVMWEIDINYDEEKRFRSTLLNLPVMVADPELTEEEFSYWKEDFNKMESSVVNLDASDLVDMDVAARYLLVYEALKNDELGWPKSMKLFKTKGGKYIFGPIWDFDTSMGKEWGGECFTIEKAENKVWRNLLFSFLEEDPKFDSFLRAHWAKLRGALPELNDFIDDYTEKIYNSGKRNEKVWDNLEDFEGSVIKLKEWLRRRFEWLDRIYYMEK